jgi:hypothetical protein
MDSKGRKGRKESNSSGCFVGKVKCRCSCPEVTRGQEGEKGRKERETGGSKNPGEEISEWGGVGLWVD